MNQLLCSIKVASNNSMLYCSLHHQVNVGLKVAACKPNEDGISLLCQLDPIAGAVMDPRL